MMNFNKKGMLVLALCIAGIFCFGQQENSGTACKPGDITNDSLLPYIQSLQINCDTKDLATYTQKNNQLTALNRVVLKGDAADSDWSELFGALKLHPAIKEILFTDDTFAVLPSGYEKLGAVERITFMNNDGLDYKHLIAQLSGLPNLQELTMDIITIFDLPDSLQVLKNISKVTLINTDDAISKNETSLFSEPKDPVTYDYYIDKGDKKYAALKYCSMAGEIDSDEYKELSKRFKTTFDPDGGDMAFVPKYTYVKPPLKGIDVERTTYTLNPNIENVITYPSGTMIRIPANAFADRNGNPVTETVTLNYREFRDPVDFLVSGIPMKYDTGGVVTNFESAGMFELTASVQAAPLKLAAGKKIDMNFASTSKDSTYNFYSFNDSTGNWNYLNKPQTVTPATTIKVKPATRAYQVFKSMLVNNLNVYDSTTFDKRFESSMHIYTRTKDTSVSHVFSYKKDRKYRQKPMEQLVKINRVRRTHDGDVLFKLSSVANAHPELHQFDNVYFAVNENMNANEFRKKYQRKKAYNDVRIYANGSDVEVKLKDNQSTKDIAASLVTLDNKGKIKKTKDTNARMRRYNRQLASRGKAFDKKLAKGKVTDNTIRTTDPEKISKYAYYSAKKEMSAAEKKMSYDQWLSYCKQTEENQALAIKQMNAKEQANVSKMGATAGNLVQSLQLDGMGIYNCDQIQRMKKPVEIFAGYKSGDNKKVNAKSAYVIDKNSNSVFQYDNYLGYSAAKIAFSQDEAAQNTLLAIDKNGEVSVYKTEGFKNTTFKNKSHFDFVVTKINSNFTTVSDLKKLIGF